MDYKLNISLINTASDEKLLKMQEVLHPENEEWDSLPHYVKNSIEVSLQQIEEGKVISFEDFKKKHFK
jgi:hypothetical protein